MGKRRFEALTKLPSADAKLPKRAATQERDEIAAQQPPTAKLPQQRRSSAERLRRLEEAKTFVRQQLAGGPLPARVLLKAAKTAGIAERTLHRAKDLLGVTTERAGGYAGYGQWIWYPPTASVTSPVSAGDRETASTALHHR